MNEETINIINWTRSYLGVAMMWVLYLSWGYL